MGSDARKYKKLTAEGVQAKENRTPVDDIGVGFWATDALTYTIAENTDGTGNTTLNLGANYKVIGIQCEDCSNIPAQTNMSAQVAFDANSAIHDLYEQDDPATEWSQGALPTTGTLAFILTHAFGTRKIRLILSNMASGGDVVFKIFGFHSGS